MKSATSLSATKRHSRNTFPIPSHHRLSHPREEGRCHVGSREYRGEGNALPDWCTSGILLSGFRCRNARTGVLRFNKKSGLKYILISEKGCADPDTQYPLKLTNDLLPLDTHTFDKDALILEGSQVRRVTLYNKEKSPLSQPPFRCTCCRTVVATCQECPVCLH